MRRLTILLFLLPLLAPAAALADPGIRTTVQAMDALAVARTCLDDVDCLLAHGSGEPQLQSSADPRAPTAG